MFCFPYSPNEIEEKLFMHEMAGKNLNQVLETCDLDKESSWLVIREENLIDKGRIKWSVKLSEFDALKFSSCVRSPYFNLGSKNYCESLRINIYPRGRDVTCEGFISVCIAFNKVPMEGTEVKGSVTLIDPNGVSDHTEKFYGLDKQLNAVTLDRFIDEHQVNTYANGDELTLLCIIKIKSRLAECVSDKTRYVATPIAEIADYRHKMLHNESLTDVQLNVGAQQINAHKAILASRISDFKILFKAAPSENAFDINDVESDILQKIVHFIYTGDIPELSFKTACKVFMAANQYGIYDLQGICAAYLGANLSSKNVFVVQMLANKHNDEHLKKVCINFIKRCNTEELAEQSVIVHG